MSNVEIKICGMQPGDNLSFVEDSRVSHLGIIFVERSRRYVQPKDAKAMVDSVRNHVRTVGVFANETVSQVCEVARTSGIDVVQLHGHESAEMCTDLTEQGFEVWKTVSVPLTDVPHEAIAETIVKYRDVCHALLLDASVGSVKGQTGLTGGHGVRFDWTVLDALAPILADRRFFVAGGLTPANVGELLSVCRPTGVDVSSGVESNGRKNMNLISQFIEAVDQS